MTEPLAGRRLQTAEAHVLMRSKRPRGTQPRAAKAINGQRAANGRTSIADPLDGASRLCIDSRVPARARASQKVLRFERVKNGLARGPIEIP